MRTTTKPSFPQILMHVLLPALLLPLHAHAAPSPHDHPDWSAVRQEIGESKRDLPGQCQDGMYNLLASLDGIRQSGRYPDFFDTYDYGPVHKEGTETGHYGVAIYPKRQPGQTYEDALMGGRVLDHTNYWSNITGLYRDRGWDEWRWWGKFGKGRPYDDTKRFKDTYWNADGPIYPASQPPGDSLAGPLYPPNFLASVLLQFVTSLDPNDKTGSVGAGPGHAVPAAEPLSYVIKFENLAEATAPAKNVVVTDPLDPTTMDLATLALGPIVIAGSILELPDAAQSYAATLDLRPDKDLLLEIWVALDPDTNELSWTFLSLDPATGRRPVDPFNGFLPPNVEPPQGEGSVSFTVAPLVSLFDGTEVANQASIVFDANDAIATPVWTNTIDTQAPSSQVDAATAAACAPSADVTWTALDAEAGVRDVRVLVSEDGGAPVEWHVADGSGSASFAGDWGRTYAFHTIAADAVGNVEDSPPTADAAVTLDDCGPHDLAITGIEGPRKVKVKADKAPKSSLAKVVVQNRGVRAQTISDYDTLSDLVALEVTSGGGCAAPVPSLRLAKPQKDLPLLLEPGKKLKVVFDVLFSCVNDGAKSTKKDPGHADYTLAASLDHSALGGADEHATDDVCPRSVAPPGELDPYPDGSILDKGCGAAKDDGTRGGDVEVDLYVRP